jgi:hypothetical protein
MADSTKAIGCMANSMAKDSIFCQITHQRKDCGRMENEPAGSRSDEEKSH